MTNVKYKTRNSVWEVEWDADGGAVRARRLAGLDAITERTPPEGTWRDVEAAVDLPNNAGLWIQWVGLPRGSGTWTSEIVARSNDERKVVS